MLKPYEKYIYIFLIKYFVWTKEFARILFKNSPLKKKKEKERKRKREINTIFPSKVNLTNRQLLEFARLVAGKIARLPTRRAVPSISKTETEIRRFLSFASFNYFHVKQAWFRANTARGGTASLDPALSAVEIQWKATLHAEECQELTASRNFIRTNRFGSRITRRRRRRHAVAWRLEFQGLFQVSNIEEERDIRQTWKSSQPTTFSFHQNSPPANRNFNRWETVESIVSSSRRYVLYYAYFVSLLEEYRSRSFWNGD